MIPILNLDNLATKLFLYCVRHYVSTLSLACFTLLQSSSCYLILYDTVLHYPLTFYSILLICTGLCNLFLFFSYSILNYKGRIYKICTIDHTTENNSMKLTCLILVTTLAREVARISLNSSNSFLPFAKVSIERFI